MKKVGGIAITIILAIAMIASSSTMIVAEEDEDVEPIPIDIGPKIRNSICRIDTSFANEKIGNNTLGNGIKFWPLYDTTTDDLYLTPYVLVAENPNTAQIWVQQSIYNTDQIIPILSNVNYILDEYSDNILPTDELNFGSPITRDGTNSLVATVFFDPEYYKDTSERHVILISDIIDENFYDPSYPYYVAGFFHPGYIDLFDRNIITIDSYDWINRIGPDVKYPYTYEGTIAHELQHLIHYDLDSGETTWINEGCSMYAETLCGYGFQTSASNHFFFTPDNSLTIWGDQTDINILADYGQTYLFVMYLFDHYGREEIIKYIANNPLHGKESITDSLINKGHATSFEEVFIDWTLANLLRKDSGPYGYTSYNMNLLDPINSKMPPISSFYGSSLGNTFSMEGNDTGVSNLGPWGTDYVWIDGATTKNIIELIFDGQDTPYVYKWQEVRINNDAAFWSNAYNLLDAVLAQRIDLEGTSSPELTFDTLYDIEDEWDFGFVQVSTDNGNTWTSLQNTTTTSSIDPPFYPNIIDNLPGFTGLSNGWNTSTWTTETFDLSAYAGQEILLSFRYMTDWSTVNSGWYIDNISIDDNSTTIFYDDCSDITQWMCKAEAFGYDMDFDVKFYNPYTDTITNIPLNDINEYGSIVDFHLGGNLHLGNGILIISYTPDHNMPDKADYWVNFVQEPDGGAAISSFPLFTTALNKVNPVLDSALAAIAAAEEGGKDTSSINELMENVNEHIANSSTGANYIYKANQLRLAMQTLEEVMSQLSEL